MKQTLTLLLAGAAVATLGGGAASAQSVRVDNAIARVVYMPEARSDIAVEIQQGNSNLPALEVVREGGNVRIDGNIYRRGPRTRALSCEGGRRGDTPPSRPGEGASASVRGTGRVELSNAPLIIIRGPRDADVRTDGAVFGAIGRGAENVRLAHSGCGNWVIANVANDTKVSIGGSGDVWTGSARKLDVSIGGSGDIRSTAVGDLSINIAGSGDVEVQRAEGDARISIAGSGDVDITDGRIGQLQVNIMGSGDVQVGGVVRDVSASIAGAGDIVIDRVTGNVSKRAVGSGDVRVRRRD